MLYKDLRVWKDFGQRPWCQNKRNDVLLWAVSASEDVSSRFESVFQC